MITAQTQMSRAAETFAADSIKVDPNLDELLAEQAFASRMQGVSVLQATMISDAIKRHVLVRAERTPDPCTHVILLNAHGQGNPCVDRAAATLTKRPNKGHACWNITCQLPMGASLGIDE